MSIEAIREKLALAEHLNSQNTPVMPWQWPDRTFTAAEMRLALAALDRAEKALAVLLRAMDDHERNCSTSENL